MSPGKELEEAYYGEAQPGVHKQCGDYNNSFNRGARINHETRQLDTMFIEGPDVSLNGSPTVSPTTAALCGSDFL